MEKAGIGVQVRATNMGQTGSFGGGNGDVVAMKIGGSRGGSGSESLAKKGKRKKVQNVWKNIGKKCKNLKNLFVP